MLSLEESDTSNLKLSFGMMGKSFVNAYVSPVISEISEIFLAFLFYINNEKKNLLYPSCLYLRKY